MFESIFHVHRYDTIYDIFFSSGLLHSNMDEILTKHLKRLTGEFHDIHM